MKGIATIIIAKHRNGAVGEVNLRFRAELTLFEDLETVSPFGYNDREVVTQTFTSKINDEETPALDQGFGTLRSSFESGSNFEDAPF